METPTLVSHFAQRKTVFQQHLEESKDISDLVQAITDELIYYANREESFRGGLTVAQGRMVGALLTFLEDHTRLFQRNVQVVLEKDAPVSDVSSGRKIKILPAAITGIVAGAGALIHPVVSAIFAALGDMVGRDFFGSKEDEHSLSTSNHSARTPWLHINIAGLTQDFEAILSQVDQFMNNYAPAGQPQKQGKPEVPQEAMELLQDVLGSALNVETDAVIKRITSFLRSYGMRTVQYSDLSTVTTIPSEELFEVIETQSLTQSITRVPAIVKGDAVLLRGQAFVPKQEL